ncbi:iduronate 2-sulfatase-like [Oscarella lobularis]|uniref:iduronate 2-sulfatase-like n=1 Tax=Oscarella lobularis TaxID=121494 RepID=UPI003313F971
MAILTSFAVVLAVVFGCWAAAERKNVLFLAIDDLRPELGCYGSAQALSPHIDQLAAKSLLFERAYCQQALCSPSRASLLTGRRPDTNHVWLIDPDEYWRKVTNATTIPQYFKENGYISIGMGKVFHPGGPSGFDDVLYSWSPEGLPYYHAPLEKQYGPGQNKTSLWWGFDGFEDNDLPDGQICDQAIKTLQALKANRTKGDQRPFFLAIGFHKPHIPHFAPKKYFDMYPDATEIALPANPRPPVEMPDVAWSTWNHIREFDNLAIYFEGKNCTASNTTQMLSTECALPDEATREARRGYYATMTYSDYQVGKVLAELEAQGFANDTIVVLWGDHGWHLGELGEWAKFTNFEDDTRVPFLLHVPGVTDIGMRSDALVELIDIFPTLVDITGLPKVDLCPMTKQPLTCVEGTSIAPLLKNPNMPFKKAAFSQYPRPTCGLYHIPGHTFIKNGSKVDQKQVMGYTMRTKEYRYTLWVGFNDTLAVPHWDDVWGEELYDHTSPTVHFNDENENLANKPNMASTKEELKKMLLAGWREAIPLK